MKFGIPDIRLLDSGDLRLHSQFLSQPDLLPNLAKWCPSMKISLRWLSDYVDL
jgi:hypothetical protein